MIWNLIGSYGGKVLDIVDDFVEDQDEANYRRDAIRSYQTWLNSDPGNLYRTYNDDFHHYFLWAWHLIRRKKNQSCEFL